MVLALFLILHLVINCTCHGQLNASLFLNDVWEGLEKRQGLLSSEIKIQVSNTILSRK